MKPTKVQKAALRKLARKHGADWFSAQEVIWALGAQTWRRITRKLVDHSYLETKWAMAEGVQLFRLTIYGWEAAANIDIRPIEERRAS